MTCEARTKTRNILFVGGPGRSGSGQSTKSRAPSKDRPINEKCEQSTISCKAVDDRRRQGENLLSRCSSKWLSFWQWAQEFRLLANVSIFARRHQNHKKVTTRHGWKMNRLPEELRHLVASRWFMSDSKNYDWWNLEIQLITKSNRPLLARSIGGFFWLCLATFTIGMRIILSSYFRIYLLLYMQLFGILFSSERGCAFEGIPLCISSSIECIAW